MGTLLTKAIEAEFANPSPVVNELLQKLIRQQLEVVLSQEVGSFTAEQKATIKTEETDVFVRVSQILSELGIQANLLGYRYLREAIVMAVADPSLLVKSFTTIIYPTIANKFESTPTRVERAIRHAIETSWSPNKEEGIKRWFGGNVSLFDKPTNSAYIATVMDKLRIELKMS